jgi:hypothetical protein
MKRITPWLIALLCAVVGVGMWHYRARQVSASTPRDPEEIIRHAWRFDHRVPLRGQQEVRMLGIHGRLLTFHAAVLAAAGNIRIEYATPPLQGVTVWETDDTTYRYNPGLKRLTVTHRKRSSPEQRVQLLLKNYTLELAGHARVAGRNAVVIDIRPRTGTRWEKVWVDPQTWTILASEDRQGKGEVLRSTRYTEIQYLKGEEQPSPAAFAPPEELVRKYGVTGSSDSSRRYSPDRLSRLIGFRIREPRWLPAGFQLKGAYKTRCSCSLHQEAARIEYSDGLKTLTLFECEEPKNSHGRNCFAAEGEARMAVQDIHGGVCYLALGTLPRDQMKRMIDSAGVPAAPR